MGVYQTFEDSPTSAWCSIPEKLLFLAMRLDKRSMIGSSHTFATLYRWQGVFVPIEVTAFYMKWCMICISLKVNPVGTGISVSTVYITISVFLLLQSVRIQDPASCVGFAVNGSTYIGITHGGPPFFPAANLSIFKLQKDLNITLASINPATAQHESYIGTLL